jgi:hypothetical protein
MGVLRRLHDNDDIRKLWPPFFNPDLSMKYTETQKCKQLWMPLVCDSFANGYHAPWLSCLAPADQLKQEYNRILHNGWQTYSHDILTLIPIPDIAKIIIEFIYPANPYF